MLDPSYYILAYAAFIAFVAGVVWLIRSLSDVLGEDH